jgi:hypothetical protein
VLSNVVCANSLLSEEKEIEIAESSLRPGYAERDYMSWPLSLDDVIPLTKSPSLIRWVKRGIGTLRLR